MSSDYKEVTQTILKGINKLFDVIAKNFYNLSFIFVWVFFIYSPFITIIMSIILLVGFIKSESYKYLRW